MGDVLNLRRARKAKQRAEKEAAAAENRTRFGRTRADRDKAAAEAELSARQLDGLRITGKDPDDRA